MKSACLILLIYLLTGCASIANREYAHSLKLAVRDDQTCQHQGWRYPDPRYVTCRMQIADQRQYRDWRNLQLMHQTQNPSAPPAYPYREIYRPLDRDRYHCQYTTEDGQDYILCDEAPRS